MLLKPILLSTIFLISIIGISGLGISSNQGVVIQPYQLHGYREIGTLSSNTPVLFTVFLPLRNEGYLYYYAEQTSNPSSPLYHHFLSKQQVEKLFYPKKQYNKILNYLKSKNFNIILTSSDSVIVAEGTVSQVHKYLGLSYVLYGNGTYYYYSAYGTSTIGAFIYSSNISEILFAHPTTLVTGNNIQNLKKTTAEISNMTFPIEAYWPTALQKVYNATSLYKLGYEGQNRTIGILDFFGDPCIQQQLAYYDKVTGLPNPPSFKIIPIGPYNPNLGIETGWAGEISLDVQISHTMAPKANITLFIANGAIPLAVAISYIDQLDNVNDLSQSFSIPEEAFSQFNAQQFYACVVETDMYYAMGSAEGITFLASSGDAGGAGYSNGPLGTVGYPSTSPFVTAVGGTTTYIQFPGLYYQSAWSNYGFVPDNVNYGGSTGGISEIEPKPYYQWGLQTPLTYPAGREAPDISGNANVYPGIYIICPGNITAITGGTSEASPLNAGLLTLVMDYTNSSLGLINPVLYQIGSNSTLYSKVFNPITFGYNIPWIASYGYNLVTGWGTLNIGEFAYYYNKISEQPSLSIEVAVLNSTGETPMEFLPGETMEVIANITYNGVPVTSGTFYATVESTQGNISKISLVYNPLLKLWIGTLTLPSNANGILFVNVYGTYNGIQGSGFYETFSGYYAQFLSPVTFLPIFTGIPCLIIANVTNIYGEQPTFPITVNVEYYNITVNQYTPITTLTLIPINASIIGYPGLIWIAKILSLPSGDLYITSENAEGFVSFTSGTMLQSLFILPPDVAEPGSVAPGQNIIIEGLPTPPENLLTITSIQTGNPVSSNIQEGTNITAELVNTNGKVISKASIPFDSEVGEYLGYLPVPSTASGLYYIYLESSYDSITLNQNVSGFFYGEIYVTNYSNVNIKTESYAYQGQTLTIYANITYPNGTEVTYGMYSATVYPMAITNEYSQISQIVELPLWYDSAIGEWIGNVTLPSTFNSGNLTYYEGELYYGAPFEILVTGLSANAYPTSNSPSAEKTFYVLPYNLIENKKLDGFQTYNAVLINDTIITNGTLTNDILVNDNISGNVRIVDSNVTNVTFYDSNVSLIYSEGYNIHSINSMITLVNSKISNINLVNSEISNIKSTVSHITPSLPTISIVSPINNENITGNITINFNVVGSNVMKDILYLNGKILTSFTGNGTFTYTLDTAKYPDGTYNLTVLSIQSDNLQSSASIYVNFENMLSSVNQKVSNLSSNVSNLSSNVSSLSSNLKSENSTLSSEISSDVSSLNSSISSTKDLIYVAIVIAIIGIIIGILAFVRKGR